MGWDRSMPHHVMGSRLAVTYITCQVVFRWTVDAGNVPSLTAAYFGAATAEGMRLMGGVH